MPMRRNTSNEPRERVDAAHQSEEVYETFSRQFMSVILSVILLRESGKLPIIAGVDIPANCKVRSYNEREIATNTRAASQTIMHSAKFGDNQTQHISRNTSYQL